MDRTFTMAYVGELNAGGTCLQRLRALEELGHTIYPVDVLAGRDRKLEVLLSRATAKLFRMGVPGLGPLDVAAANARLLDVVHSHAVDIVWIDKGLTIRPRTLRQIRAHRPTCAIVGYSPDDMNARHNQSAAFLDGLPLYDVFFTTKSYGVAELQALGCRRVHFVANSYDPRTHRPMPLTSEEKTRLGGGIGFIGIFEKERAATLLNLALRGLPVRVYGLGRGWAAYERRSPNLRIEKRGVYGDDYARVISACDINLCFLRKLNRDRQTTRSVEIPACGAFMLGERTEEHEALFEEGREAEFFASDAELYEKARFYLDHPDERRRVAAAGRERCLGSGYSHADRLRKLVQFVDTEVLHERGAGLSVLQGGRS